MNFFYSKDNLVALLFKYNQARRRFVEWAQNEIAVVPDFHKRILFSDEAHFWLNGYVNKQNCRIWSEANPQVYVETPLHPEKLTVWCALWAGGIIGPYFFKNDEGRNVTVNGDQYRAMITNFFIPELNNHDVQELWFQQDGATCHTARATIDLLKDTFGDRLISRFGHVNWPPTSCDLAPLDYILCGLCKAVINSTITPNMTFTKTSQKFGQWSDIRANTVYGLGFASEPELNKDEVEKLAYQLNEEAERTERPIRRLSKVMYGSTCADMQVDVMGECLSSIKHVVGTTSGCFYPRSNHWEVGGRPQCDKCGCRVRNCSQHRFTTLETISNYRNSYPGFSNGRPRGTTPADDRYIVLQARRNRRQTAGEIARHMTQATGRPISRFTVARRLHFGGLFARLPVRCVPLTPAHRRRRSLWCREHRNWRDNE
ncbi:hypothetical protein TNCV_2510751 [Trichonephila clavipes]|nr:hypothetical protein TNCV_2510751 [Trichonephila clavipes]